MSDNLGYTPGSGASVRSKEKSGHHAQVFVIDIGGGGGELLLAAGQALMTGSVPVAIASDQTVIPISAAALETTQANILTALQIMDDWDESDRVKVNPIVDQIGVQGGAGVVTANTQRIAIASNANLVSSKTGLVPTGPASGSAEPSSDLLIDANPNRKGLMIINVSGVTISLAFGTTAILNSGITLFPKQSFWMDEFSFTTAEIQAISSSGSAPVAWQEFE